MASETERRNLQHAGHWERRWSGDADAMVAECYAPDCIVTDMLTGDAVRGRDALRRREHELRRLSGPRRIEITRMVANGDKVAVQMDVVRQDRRSRTCAFLTFDQDGLIMVDNWYGEGPAGRGSPAAPRGVGSASPASAAL